MGVGSLEQIEEHVQAESSAYDPSLRAASFMQCFLLFEKRRSVRNLGTGACHPPKATQGGVTDNDSLDCINTEQTHERTKKIRPKSAIRTD